MSKIGDKPIIGEAEVFRDSHTRQPAYTSAQQM